MYFNSKARTSSGWFYNDIFVILPRSKTDNRFLDNYNLT